MIHWLWGDRYLADEEAKRICVGMPVKRFDGASDDLSDILSDLATADLFDDARCVIIDNFSVTTGRFSGKKSDKPRDQLLKALETLPDSIQLIFISERTDVDMRVKLAKTIAERAKVQKFETPGWWAGKAVAEFARERVRAAGKSIDEDALSAIVEEIGSDMGRIASEVDKIMLSLDDGEKRIATRHLSVLSGGAGDVFHLASTVANRNLKDAVPMLDDLLRQNVQPTQILSRISASMRDLLHARAIIDKRGGPNEVAKALGITPGRAHFTMQDARKYSRDELQSAIHTLMRADLALKRGGRPHEVLSLVLLAVCGQISTRQFYQAFSAYDAK